MAQAMKMNHSMHFNSNQQRSRKRRGGTTLVEFALILSMLMMLTLGMVQYGLIMNTMLTLSHISRAGARYAAVHATETNYDAVVKAYIQQLCQSSSIKYSDISTAPGSTVITFSNPAAHTSGTSVTVTLTFPMGKKIFMPNGVAGVARLNRTVTAASTMVIE